MDADHMLRTPDAVPVLRTARLTLRALDLEDVGPYSAYWATERSRHMGGPRDARWAWGKLAAHVGHWTLRGFGFWSVRAGDAPVGVCGLHRPEPHPHPMLGWILYRGATGRGYATEAARAALDWWFARGETSAMAHIARGNAASHAVARRLGGVDTGRVPEHEEGDLAVWTFSPEARAT